MIYYRESWFIRDAADEALHNNKLWWSNSMGQVKCYMNLLMFHYALSYFLSNSLS
jgi:hypothetical protein